MSVSGISCDLAGEGGLLAPQLALAIACIAPFFFGCSPPWASGLLVAVFCILVAAHIIVGVARGCEWFPVSPSLKIVSLGLLFWPAAVVAFDMALGTARGRTPAVSLRELPFAAAYFGAAVLGAAYRARGGIEGWRGALKAVSVTGILLALAAFAEYFAAWDIKAILGGADQSPRLFRMSGPYVNPNRFAVLMAVCWSCAAGGAIHGLVSRSASRSQLWTAVFLASALAAGTCVGLTLSRLAVVSVGVALCLAAAAFTGHGLRRARLRGADEALPRVERVRLGALAALPVVAMVGWGAWSLAAGEWRLRERFADLAGQDPNVAGRLAVIRAALPLLAEHPVAGCGLGMFESVFAGIQPPELPGRWREVHSDWLQPAIEAGLPMLAMFVAAAALWGRAFLRSVRLSVCRSVSRPWMLLLPAAGVMAALACSLLDFPLREPATAVLVFFLAGGMAVASDVPKEKDRAPIAPGCLPASRAGTSGTDEGEGGNGGISAAENFVPSPAGWRIGAAEKIAGAASAALLLVCAVVAGREGLAYAASPWAGRVFCPPPDTSLAEGWRRAAAVDGGSPEILYRLASCEAAPAPGGSRDLPSAREKVRAAAAIQPFDYRLVALEAGIAEEIGDPAAADLWERAAELAPCYPAVRMRCGAFYLRRAERRSGLEEAWRSLDIADAVRHFRAVLAVEPQRTQEIVSELDRAGCADVETVELWPGEDAASRLTRARFYIERRKYENARRELPSETAVGPEDACWYHALKGRLELSDGLEEDAARSWAAALSREPFGEGKAVHEWIAGEVRQMDIGVIEALHGRLAGTLRRAPRVAVALAGRLMGEARWAAADAVLEEAAAESAEACAMWAELALRLGDFPSAEQRAKAARLKGDDSPRWTSWYDRFMERLARERIVVGRRQPGSARSGK